MSNYIYITHTRTYKPMKMNMVGLYPLYTYICLILLIMFIELYRTRNAERISKWTHVVWFFVCQQLCKKNKLYVWLKVCNSTLSSKRIFLNYGIYSENIFLTHFVLQMLFWLWEYKWNMYRYILKNENLFIIIQM